MQTDDQFLMLVDDPEKSSKFNKDREKYGRLLNSLLKVIFVFMVIY
jgi:hypothetical protein